MTADGLIPWWGILVIIGGSFLAGYVDSIAGGGGLIALPAFDFMVRLRGVVSFDYL